MTAAQAIEQIRSALEAIAGTPDEELVLRSVLKHISARRPECLASLGAAFESSPTEPRPIAPPKGTP